MVSEMEDFSFVPTRFSYRRDTKLFAEIEVVRMENSYYKFIIHPTEQWQNQEESLTHLRIQPDKSYNEQLACLRAAIRYLSTLGPCRLT